MMTLFAYLGMGWASALALALVWFVIGVCRDAWRERQLRKRIAEQLARDPYVTVKP